MEASEESSPVAHDFAPAWLRIPSSSTCASSAGGASSGALLEQRPSAAAVLSLRPGYQLLKKTPSSSSGGHSTNTTSLVDPKSEQGGALRPPRAGGQVGVTRRTLSGSARHHSVDIHKDSEPRSSEDSLRSSAAKHHNSNSSSSNAGSNNNGGVRTRFSSRLKSAEQTSGTGGGGSSSGNGNNHARNRPHSRHDFRNITNFHHSKANLDHPPSSAADLLFTAGGTKEHSIGSSSSGAAAPVVGGGGAGDRNNYGRKNGLVDRRNFNSEFPSLLDEYSSTSSSTSVANSAVSMAAGKSAPGGGRGGGKQSASVWDNANTKTKVLASVPKKLGFIERVANAGTSFDNNNQQQQHNNLHSSYGGGGNGGGHKSPDGVGTLNGLRGSNVVPKKALSITSQVVGGGKMSVPTVIGKLANSQLVSPSPAMEILMKNPRSRGSGSGGNRNEFLRRLKRSEQELGEDEANRNNHPQQQQQQLKNYHQDSAGDQFKNEQEHCDGGMVFKGGFGNGLPEPFSGLVNGGKNSNMFKLTTGDSKGPPGLSDPRNHHHRRNVDYNRHQQLSSSLEEEERLLRQMGWKEEEEDETFCAPLTEDEVKEFRDLILARNELNRRSFKVVRAGTEGGLNNLNNQQQQLQQENNEHYYRNQFQLNWSPKTTSAGVLEPENESSTSSDDDN